MARPHRRQGRVSVFASCATTVARCAFGTRLVRGIMWPLESWGPALIASIISKRGKRFGDMLAGTIVVQERIPGGTAMPTQMPPPLAWWATTLDLSRFGDDIALAVRQFLARQHELNPSARDAMGGQLVAAVMACTTPPPPPGTPGWAYLSAVLAERRRREAMRTQGGVPYGGVPYGTGAPAPAYGAGTGCVRRRTRVQRRACAVARTTDALANPASTIANPASATSSAPTVWAI